MLEYIYRGKENEETPKETTNVKFASSVKVIHSFAFNGCSSLTRIDIPSSVEVIEAWAFADCTGLTSIKIPPSVKTIDKFVFHRCLSLTSIEIPSSVESFLERAFFECESLDNITLPSSVKFIGEGAFQGCLSLSSIDIPSSVETIEYMAFMFCMSLEQVYISSKCKYEDSVFPGDVVLIHGWHDVGPYILLRELIKKKRAIAITTSGNDNNLDLSIIQNLIINASDDIFRSVLEYLVSCEETEESDDDYDSESDLSVLSRPTLMQS